MAACWAVGVFALLVYWSELYDSHQARRHEAQAQVQLRAARMAQAQALQADTQLGQIDYIARHLGEHWFDEDEAAFRRTVEVARRALPEGALVQVMVADAQGWVVFAEHAGPAGRRARVSIAGRDAFKVHPAAGAPQLFVGAPARDRASQQWAVPFSRPLQREGAFAGVVVLSISPAYLAEALRSLFPDPADAALLVLADGTYLARSHRLDEVLGRSVPAERPFLADPAAQAGLYEAVAAVDGVARQYAWRRAGRYPVVASVGLNAAKALAPVERALADSRWRNGFGSALLLLAAAWISGLFVDKERQASQRRKLGERLELALIGGDLASWDWHLPSGACAFDARWAAMFGCRPEELASEIATWEKRVHPDDWREIRPALAAHLDGQTEQYENEHRLRHRDGHWVWVLDRGRVVERDSDGRAVRMVGTLLDISARKAADAAVAESRQRLTKLLAEVPGAVYQFLLRRDGSSCFPYASPGIRDIYGLSPDEAARSAGPVFERIHPEDLARVSASIEQSAQRLDTWQCTYRVVALDGSVRWLSGQANPERTPEGDTLWHGYIHDITAGQAAADALRESEERLRQTVEAVRDGLWSWNLRSGALEWDARCYEMLGYPDRALVMSFPLWIGLLHPLDRESTLAYLQQQIEQAPGQVIAREFRLRTADDRWLWVEARGRIVGWTDDGHPARMVGTYTDIGLRVAEAQFRRALLDQSTAAIALVSSRRRIVRANARAHELFALPGEPLAGVDMRRLYAEEKDYRAMGQQYAALREQGQVRCEVPMCDARGQLRWFDIHGVLQDPDNPEGDAIWTLIDVTERHCAQVALATERLRLTTLLQRFPGGVLMEDAEGVVAMANQRWCDLLELDEPAAALEGCPHAGLRARLGEVRAGWLHRPTPAGQGERRHSIEVENGHGLSLEIDWVPIERAGQVLGQVWLVRDISEHKQREAMLAALAATDALTGLPNRRSFMASLEEAVRRRAGDPEGGAVLLMLDIDHFKRVNDSHGHAAGDVVLHQVAQLIRHGLREGDMAGRLGGEEFAVLLRGAGVEDGRLLAERLRQTVADTPARTEAGSIRVTVSIGLCALGGESGQRSLSRADEALYAAKAGGRNRVEVWSAGPR